MREILFRAKRLDNGEWVEGDLLRESDVYENVITRIYEMKAHHTFIKHEVIPETVCQYTGLTDKNGKKIFENDILERNIFETKTIGVVTWMNIGSSSFYLKVKTNDGYSLYPIGRGKYDNDESVECNDLILGNAFDNPELLKVEEE